MKQYFEVGEEVIIQSDKRPDFNGDAVIIMVTKGNEYIDPCSGKKVNLTTSGDYIGYLVQGIYRYVEGGETKIYNPFKQSSLRKKHQPGESHNTFMDKIKSGDKIEEPA